MMSNCRFARSWGRGRLEESRRGKQEMVGSGRFARTWRKGRLKYNKSGQQGMVGFVLIIAVVVVALMIFLVISIKKGPTETSSLEVDNLLGSVMKYTTKCAVNFEPQYDDVEDLFKSCYKGDQCKNLGKDSCIYLKESLDEILRGVMDPTVESYRLEFYSKEVEGNRDILSFGECKGGKVNSALRVLVLGSNSLGVRLKLCGA